MNTSGKQALYDSLDRDEAIALAVDDAVRRRQDGWRTNPVKVKKVRNAIRATLLDDETATERVLELVKNQNEY
jgi:type I restriction enzyme R subunit